MALADGAADKNGRQTIGAALLDVSTGEFTAAEYTGADGMQALQDELALLRPRRFIAPFGLTASFLNFSILSRDSVTPPCYNRACGIGSMPDRMASGVKIGIAHGPPPMAR